MGKYKINPRTGKFDIVGSELKSSDGSVDIKETAEGIDVSVPLATEQNNGLESSHSKTVRDHSFMNIVSLASDNSYASAHEANAALCLDDSEYYPVAGQEIQYIARQDGKMKRYRYRGNFLIQQNGNKEWWCGATYDYRNKVFIINRNTEKGSRMKVARSSSGVFWQITDYANSRVEKRPYIGSCSWSTAIMSANESSEYEITYDGGDSTWLYKTLSRELYYQRIKGATVLKDGVETEVLLFIAMGKTYMLEQDGSESLFISQRDILNSLGKNLNIPDSKYQYDASSDVCVSIENGEQNLFLLWFKRSEYTFHVTWVRDGVEKSTYNFSDPISKIDYSGGKLYCYRGEAGNISTETDCYILDVNYEINTLSLNKKVEACHAIQDTLYGLCEIRHKSIMVDGTLIELPVQLSSSEYLTSFAYDGGHRLLVVVGGHIFNEQTGNYAFCIDLIKKKVMNDNNWEEITLITPEASGILSVEDSELKALLLDDYLRYDKSQRKLSAFASDRTTEYSNYLLRGYGVADVWCKVALSSVVDDTTKVYSDESCTEEVGTIHRHGYNINNPLDVDVDISGVSYVFTFHNSKMPTSLATTKALISAIDEIMSDLDDVESILNTING